MPLSPNMNQQRKKSVKKNRLLQKLPKKVQDDSTPNMQSLAVVKILIMEDMAVVMVVMTTAEDMAVATIMAAVAAMVEDMAVAMVAMAVEKKKASQLLAIKAVAAEEVAVVVDAVAEEAVVVKKEKKRKKKKVRKKKTRKRKKAKPKKVRRKLMQMQINFWVKLKHSWATWHHLMFLTTSCATLNNMQNQQIQLNQILLCSSLPCSINTLPVQLMKLKHLGDV